VIGSGDVYCLRVLTRGSLGQRAQQVGNLFEACDPEDVDLTVRASFTALHAASTRFSIGTQTLSA
jgi:hypothetical protein